MIFILFLFGSWLAGSMMNFQFVPGEGGTWDFSFLGPFVTIGLFAVPVLIFWRARTRIFFIMFSAALFWIITPIFFQALTALLIGLTFGGFILVMAAFKKGYISKKMTAMLIGVTVALGGGIFYLGGSAPAHTGVRRPGERLLPDFLHEIFEGSGLFILVLIGAFALGFFVYQRYELFDLFESSEEEEEIESDVSSAVDRAIQDLLEGKDIETTIMECYSQMSSILEEEGVRDEKHMTPREFEKTADERLSVATDKISQIREIFELAKYSSHKLKETDKEQVIEDLEALKEELK